jgi:hypothetical protein
MQRIAALGILLVAIPLHLEAQEAAPGPRAGAWGAELSFDGDNALGAALLRFRNDRSAWTLGLQGDYRKRGDDAFSETGVPLILERTDVQVDARLGFRSFGSPGSAIRPTFGGGVLGAIAQASGQQKLWEVGLYGELGISRFFGPNFSLGVLSDLQVRRAARSIGDSDSTDWRVGFDAVRVAATVVF